MFLVQIILWIIFIGSAVLLSVVILLQESKGGGLAEAFGGMGAQTFGVKASGINKFTAYVAVVFLASAVLITCVRKEVSVADLPETLPADPAAQEGSPFPGTGATGDGTPDGK